MGTDGQETLETVYHRGLHGDKAYPSGGTRTVVLPALDLNSDGDTTDAGDAPAVNDEDAFAGQVRAQTVYDGVDTDPVTRSAGRAWQSPHTASRDMGQTTVYASASNPTSPTAQYSYLIRTNGGVNAVTARASVPCGGAGVFLGEFQDGASRLGG